MSENACGGAVSYTNADYKELLENPEWLHRQYVELEKSYSDIGAMLDVSQATVWRHAQKHDIKSRSFGEFQVKDKRLKERDWFYQMYIDKDKSLREIADICGCHPNSAQYWRKKHGIESKRDCSPVDPRVKNESWLREKYIDKKMDTREIADLLGEHQSTVYRKLIRFGIELREQGVQTGEEHWNWKGGHSEYYGPNWEEQRRIVLERDSYKCRGCGESQENIKTELHVHHIRRLKWYKENYDTPEWYEKGNDESNLISLCYHCHPKWEDIPLKPQ